MNNSMFYIFSMLSMFSYSDPCSPTRDHRTQQIVEPCQHHHHYHQQQHHQQQNDQHCGHLSQHCDLVIDLQLSEALD